MDDRLRLFAGTAAGVWAVDQSQRIVLWNEAAERMLGYSAAEALGRPCHQILAGRDVQGHAVCQASCGAGHCARQGEYPGPFQMSVRCRNGQTCWLDVNVVVVPEGLEEEQQAAWVHIARCLGSGGAWPPPLRIRLLGPVAVERADGWPVEAPQWRRSRVRALLVLLALGHGELVHRDSLLERLWPELDRPAALRNLHITAHHLRRSLEPDLKRGDQSCYVQCEEEGYLLSGGGVHWLDVAAFERGIDQARQAREIKRAHTLYQEALALYRGDFAADLDPDLLNCWMERERLRQLYLNATEELADLCVRQDDQTAAAELYLKILAVEPCRESAGQQLMRAALRRGDRAAALLHYRQLQTALQRELEIQPGPETERLHQLARAAG